MEEWFQKNWGWLVSFVGLIGSGALYLIGIRSDIDKLKDWRDAHVSQNAKDHDELSRRQTRIEDKVDSVLEHLDSFVNRQEAHNARQEERYLMMIEMLKRNQ